MMVVTKVVKAFEKTVLVISDQFLLFPFLCYFTLTPDFYFEKHGFVFVSS